jgi:uncharacterized protein (DUF885 family)
VIVGRDASSFSRHKAQLKPQALTLVLCEDSKSSKQYLSDAARYFRSYALVEIAHCGKTDPKNIVEEAVARRKKFDSVYCAIDRDAHENFDEALQIARSNDVQVVASYPCYEFWLLLHFRFSREPHRAVGTASSGDRMVKTLRAEPGMEQYRKGDDTRTFTSLLDRLPVARSRAAQTLAQALVDGEMNPSTRLHVLIEELEKLGTPRLVDGLSALKP